MKKYTKFRHGAAYPNRRAMFQDHFGGAYPTVPLRGLVPRRVEGPAMPVELIIAGGWLLTQAYKLILEPVADDVRKDVAKELAGKISQPILKLLFGHQTDEDERGAADKSDSYAGPMTDTAVVDAIEEAPEEERILLRGEIKNILGVEIDASEVEKSADEWYLSAYAAILWRIAMLAVWEKRPIAIQGALQGRDWVTVCVPRAFKTIDPYNMWRRYNHQKYSHMLLRELHNEGPAEFFVRRVEDESLRGSQIAALNKKFRISPAAGFEPSEEATSFADGWHRINGFGAVLVLLKPDAATEQAATETPAGMLGLSSSRDLDLSPLVYDEYPPKWQPLLDIDSEQDAIVALSAGADEFARASDRAKAAVKNALTNRNS